MTPLTRRQQIGRIKAALTRLGKLEPDEIALTLKKKGVKGYKRAAANCPVSKYIKQRGGARAITGGIHTRFVLPGDPESEDNETVVRMSPTLVMFTHCFDEGKYPELVDMGRLLSDS